MLFLSFLLWLILLAIFAYERLSDATVERRERERISQLVGLRRQYVSTRKDDPNAHEMLGDALRNGGFPSEALDAYGTALALAANNRGALSPGIDSKVRLTRLEIVHDERPHEFGLTQKTRDIVCRRCGRVSPPSATHCDACGDVLPVDGFLDTLARPDLRDEIKREMTSFGTKAAVILIAILCSAWMPLEIRATLFIAAIIVVPIAWLRRFGDPSR